MSVLYKIASQHNSDREENKYRWYDPVIDEPLPITRSELMLKNKYQSMGSIVGGTGGALLAGSLMYYGRKDPKANITPGSALATMLSFGTTGAVAGAGGGKVLANRAIYHDRLKGGRPLKPETETLRKLQRHDRKLVGKLVQ